MTGRARAKAVAAWKEPLPDWVAALADESDRTSQAAVADRVGYSPGVVSSVLGRTYLGAWSTVEDRVRGALLGGMIACPEMGEMPLHQCHDWRRRAQKFSGTNALVVRMFRACNGCLHNRRTEE